MSFNARSIDVKYFLCWIHACTVAPKRAALQGMWEGTLCNMSAHLTTGNRWEWKPGVARAWYWESGPGPLWVAICTHLLWKRETLAFCTFSSACSEVGMSLFGSLMEHASSRPCWRLLSFYLRLQRPFLGLALQSWCDWGGSPCPFVLSCVLFD